ncbi:MAG: HlyD family efflux transporter periplasmic adaptor subunit [Pirellulales bacterium]|nr:HlyD family efflux transporter periplasmic adaptor subunit [Pirellulales bacterium]
MKEQITKWIGRGVTLAIITACVVVASNYLLDSNEQEKQDEIDKALVHEVAQSDFAAFVTETGDVVSASNEEVRCEIESRNGAGTQIIWIIEEGTNVEEGEELIHFDSAALENEFTAQKIIVANDKALLTQAESNLDNAKRTLTEYKEGLYQQEVNVLEGDLFVAREELKRYEALFRHSKKLAQAGFITQLQLEGDEFRLEKAQRDVDAAQLKLDVYSKFTKDKMIGQLEAEIAKSEAAKEAATYTYTLSTQKQQEIDDQIKACIVTAPTAGQVVYANDERRGVVIEEGTTIRHRQIVIRLPDINNMEIHVRVNESHVNRVTAKQLARIELDSDPDNTLIGEVTEVAAYPFPLRWHGAPLEYHTEVKITQATPGIRPGMRGKVRIYFEEKSSVIQVPLAAIIEHEEQFFCLIREKNDWIPREVFVGSNNNSQVIVTGGLTPGDQVALTPFRFIKRSDLPETTASTVAENNNRSKDSLDNIAARSGTR